MRTTITRRSQRGFSLPEMLIALLLFILVTNTLLDYHRAIAAGFQQQQQYRTIWRLASQQAEINPPTPPAGFQVTRQQVPVADNCTDIMVKVTSPTGRQGRLSRRHCPVVQH